MIEFDDSEVIVHKYIANRIIDSLNKALAKASKNCEKAAADTFLLEQNLRGANDVRPIAEYSKMIKANHNNLVKKLAVRNRIEEILRRNKERVDFLSERLKVAGIYNEKFDKKELKEFIDASKFNVSEESLNLNMRKKGELVCKYVLGELLHFDGASLDCSHPLNKPVILAAGYDFLSKLIRLFPKCVSTISDDMVIDVKFKHNILKAVAAYVTEEVKIKSIRDINKELGGLLSFKSEITDNVRDYIAGVQNMFDVAGKQEVIARFPEKIDEIISKLKCNEKSELLPPSRKSPALANGMAGVEKKTEEQESEELRIEQEKEAQKMDMLEMLDSIILNEQDEKTEEEELEEALKEIEAELTQNEEELKNKEVEEEKTQNQEIEDELESVMARSYTKHDD